MRTVFLGTAEFALPGLRKLAAGPHRPVGVVTQPDRKKGRGQKITAPPVKVLAGELGLEIFQPEDVNSEDARARLAAYAPELLVVIAYGKILKKEVIEIAREGAVNLHGSLLPLYRGAAPVNRAIINGETKTGVTVIRMNEKMDAGKIILKKETDVREDDTAVTLGERLARMGADILLESVDLIEKGKAVLLSQDERCVSYAKKLVKKDGLIEWQKSAEEIRNLIRGTMPWPCAFTFFRGKRLKIWGAEKSAEAGGGEPGRIKDIIENEKILVDCGRGTLALTQIQPEGGRRMNVSEYLRGYRLEKGDVLG